MRQPPRPSPRPVRVALACAASFAVFACTSFSAAPGADDGADASPDVAAPTDASLDAPSDEAEPSCEVGACPQATPSCRSYSFDGPRDRDTSCPGDWTISADSDARATCADGKLRLAGEGTQDVEARLSVRTPGMLDGVRIAARFTIEAWDGGPWLELIVGEETAGVVRAGTVASGFFRLELCRSRDDSDGCVSLAEVAPGSEHVIELDVSRDATQVSVDCAAPRTQPGLAPPASSNVELVFGKVDADPIEGTLDDVVVSFR